jgi:hypothetical protein
MKNKVPQPQSIPELTENRAQPRQLSGHSASSNAETGTQDQRPSAKRVITSLPGLVLVLFLALPSLLCAQKQKGQWSDLNGLKAGQKVEVIETNMQRHGGEFIDVNDQVLTLQEGGSNLSIKREDVVRVTTSSAPRRGEHVVIGVVAGGLIGAAVGAVALSRTGNGGSFSPTNGRTSGIGALIGIAIGAPTGALIGAGIPAHTTVYRAAPAAAAH